jgi:2-hydroxychromene-2-carboxylate isomerase
MKPLQIEVFWSFRTPYAYLLTPRLRALQDEYLVECRFRPVYPLAVRIKGFIQAQNPLAYPYIMRDCIRQAEMDGVPFAWPEPDPIVQNMTTRVVSQDQPYISRLTRLGVVAQRAGRGLEFAEQVGKLTFGGVKNWNTGSYLADAAKKAGMELLAMEGAIQADYQSIDEEISANEQALTAIGHWGVPVMGFEGEPFFGQDRFDALKWRLEKAGLTRRRNGGSPPGGPSVG